MIEYPAAVLACPATMQLLLRAMAGELPRASFYAAWEGMDEEAAKQYDPSVEIEDWMRENWHSLMPVAPSDAPAEAVPRVLAKQWMEPFLEEYAKSKNLTQSAKAAAVGRETVRLYLKRDPDFALAAKGALETFRDRVRRTFKRRGLDGWKEPVFGRVGRDQDGIVGYQRKYDPRAFMRIVEKECPEYAAAKEGNTFNLTATANADASAQAVGVVATPEKQADIQKRTKHKLAKRVERARLTAASAPVKAAA